jgi:hypothetical protein
MYKYELKRKSCLKSVEKVEGEPIEWKIERITSNNEPITDGAPEIFTERADGVQAAYNIRTDRFEVAAEAMDLVERNVQAKRDGKGVKNEEKEAKVVEMKPEVKDGGAEPTNGTSDA